MAAACDPKTAVGSAAAGDVGGAEAAEALVQAGAGDAVGAEAAVYALSVWFSPAFPVGGYAYSSGLEYAVHAGHVGDAEGLQGRIEAMLRLGAGRTEGGFFGAAHGAAWATSTEELHNEHGGPRWSRSPPGLLGTSPEEPHDEQALSRLLAVAERADIQRPTAETALESLAMGSAFLVAAAAAWPHDRLRAFAAALEQEGRQPAYPVAAGAVCGFRRIPLRMSLTAFLHALAANLVSAGVRLIPLGQTEGQRIVAALAPEVAECVEGVVSECEAAEISGGDVLDRLGSATLMVDWESVRHETQRTRLFRS